LFYRTGLLSKEGTYYCKRALDDEYPIDDSADMLLNVSQSQCSFP
jgi:hypothetical protein